MGASLTPNHVNLNIRDLYIPIKSQYLPMTTYYYLLASEEFLLEEALEKEVLKERTRNYAEQKKEIDFWQVKRPAFLEAPEMKEIKAKSLDQHVAVISTS
jgi:hypothetical protein